MLQEAKLLGKAGQWLKAAETCKRILSRPMEPVERAEILKETGYCLMRAVTQSRSITDFRKTAQEAQEFYLQASKEFETVPGRLGEASHYRGAGLFCESLSVGDVTERRAILNEARTKELEALHAFMANSDMAAAAMACINLLESTVELIDIEAHAEAKRNLVEEGLKAWEALFAKEISLKTDVQDHVLAILYSWSSALRYQAAMLLSDADERKNSGDISVEHARLAVKYAQASGDDYAIAFSNVRLGWAIDEFAGEVDTAEANFRDALKYASKAEDHWLKASAYYGLCFVSYWRMSQEEDYERMRGRSKECEGHAWKAIEEATLVNYGFTTAFAYAFGLAENYLNLAKLETEDQKKAEILTKAAEMARRAVEEGRRSGSGVALSLSLHSLSKALHSLAIGERDQSRKKPMLQEALDSRRESIEKASESTPFFYWNLGVFHSYLARIIADLAETDPDRSLQLLEDSARNMEECIELCRKGSTTLPEEQTTPIAWYLSWYGDILARLCFQNREPELLERARSAFEDATAIYEKLGILGSAARMKWQTARTLQDIGELSRSADSFEDASKSYELASGGTPTLSQVYLEYSALMKAQSHAQRARLADREGENDKAAKFFLKASNLLETSSRWQMLAPLYEASSAVEHAEGSSKKEELETATDQFRRARNMLVEVEGTLQESLRTAVSEDERVVIGQLIEDTRLRSKYCLARSDLEEGRLLNRRPDRSQSVEKFAKAKRLFDELSKDRVSEEERNQLQILAMFCTAEEKLAYGDQTADPNAYAEASQIFQTIRERSRTKSIRTLTLGHLSYCKALENEAKYLAGQGAGFFDEAKMHLERAIEAYGETRSRGALAWTEATRLCLDAHRYLDRAETAPNVEEGLRFYTLAEKCLRKAANLFHSAGYQNRRAEVAESLERVRKRRRFAMSLHNVLASPPTSSPVEMSVAASHEIRAAPSPREFERANVQGRVIVSSEAEVGKNFEVQFDLVNAGSGSALLVKLERAVPKPWKAVLSTDRYDMVDGSVNLRGKKLDPLCTEGISMLAEASEAGVFDIRPKAVFIDDQGQLRTSNLDSVQVTVLAPLLLHFEKPTSEKVFTSLLEAFVKDYRDRKIFIDNAGWRTMMELARRAKVPRSALYGSGGTSGAALSELQKKRLIEVRIFPGERGRGGQIMKGRVRIESLQVQAHLRNLGLDISKGKTNQE